MMDVKSALAMLMDQKMEKNVTTSQQESVDAKCLLREKIVTLVNLAIGVLQQIH